MRTNGDELRGRVVAGHGKPVLDERPRPLGPTGEQGTFGRGREPLDAHHSRRTQPARPLEGGRRGCVGGAAAGARRDCRKRVARGRVLAHRGAGEVPGGPLRIAGREDVGESGVHRAALRWGSAVIDGRPDQRMPEADERPVQVEQSFVLGPRQRIRRQLEPADRLGHDRGAPCLFRRRDENSAADVVPEQEHPPREGALERIADLQRAVDRLVSGQLGVPEHPGQLEQGEGVAAGVADQLVHHLARADARAEQET